MSKQQKRFLSVVAACSVVLFCGALAPAVHAADDQDRDDATLVGTWRASITFPGAPIEFFDLIAFNEGGTVTDRFASVFDGPALSVSIGVWKKVGYGTFAATIENFQDTDGDGRFDVRHRVRLTLHLVDRNNFTGTSTVDTLSLDGTTRLGPSSPSAPTQGTRMRVIQE